MCRADLCHQVQTHEANVTLAVRPHVLCLRHAERRRRVNNMAGPVAHGQSTTTAVCTKRWHRSPLAPPATEPSPQGRGAGRALSGSSKLLPTRKARKLSQSRTRAARAIRVAPMRSARDTGKVGEVGAVRCHELRTQAPEFSASARQSTRNPEKRRQRSRQSARGARPAQRSSQADKGRRALARRRSRRGRLQLHARVTSAASSLLPLRVSRGSRRAATNGRHGGRPLQLRVIALGAPRELREITAHNRSCRESLRRHIFNRRYFTVPLAAPQG